MISGKELFSEISNEAVTEDGEVVGYFVRNNRMDTLEQMLCSTVTVKLPEIIVDKVCLTAAEIHAQGSGVNDDKAQEIIDRIREILTPAAGIKWEAE